MIKLIASDVDGTLVKDSAPEIYPEIFPVIRSLKEKGVIIAIASGRQYHSIANMFKPVIDDIIVIAENGAHVRCRDTDMSVKKMKKDDADSIIRQLLNYDNVDVLVSCPGICYVDGKNPAFTDLMENKYHNRVEIKSDLPDIDSDIIKIAVYRKGSIRDIGEGEMIPRFSDICHCYMAGDEWVDFVDFSTDKGDALKSLMDFFHIDRDEAVAFGDNGNDLGMLNAVSESYAVDTSPLPVQEAVRHICPGWRQKGVLEVMKNFDKNLSKEA